MLGASADILPEAGQAEIALSLRGLHSDDHYNGTVYQRQRAQNVNYVVNEQRLTDLTASYAATRRLGFSLGVPYVDASWSIPSPFNPPGERQEQNASGLGDVSLSGRYWLLDPERHPRGNIAVGLGCKVPTGETGARDTYPDLFTGAGEESKFVDMSVQPGDGGWGATVELQAFQQWKHVAAYLSGNYLINPRDTNRTPSIINGLGVAVTPALEPLLVNSVPDQYLARAGAAFPLIKGRLSGSLGFRIEGLPRYDLIGDSNGFRRPGYETFFEPGIALNAGRASYWLSVPIAMVRNRQANPYTGNPGDATFPDVIILGGWSFRFDARAPTAP